MEYYLYKGLKKPLVLFGLKNKYIYIAGAMAVLGMIIAIILSNVLGLLGLIIGLAVTGAGVSYIYKIQDSKGLFNKSKNNHEIHIFPNRIKFKKINN